MLISSGFILASVHPGRMVEFCDRGSWGLEKVSALSLCGREGEEFLLIEVWSGNFWMLMADKFKVVRMHSGDW